MLPFVKHFFQMDHNKSLKPYSDRICVFRAILNLGKTTLVICIDRHLPRKGRRKNSEQCIPSRGCFSLLCFLCVYRMILLMDMFHVQCTSLMYPAALSDELKYSYVNRNPHVSLSTIYPLLFYPVYHFIPFSIIHHFYPSNFYPLL